MQKRSLKIFLPLLIAITAPAMSVAVATIPQSINYQGTLATAAGAPVNGGVVMIFRIYNAAIGGAWLYTEA